MNRFKLLACGKIIFYNLAVPRPPIASLPDLQCRDKRALLDADRPAEHSKDPAVALGLSHVLISDIDLEALPRAKRGQRGITSHGKNMIRGGCHWLEDHFGKKNLTFLTATLPDAAMMECTPATWAVVVNRFLRILRYHLEKRGMCSEIVGCVEIQSDRLKATNGVPPLHLHLLFQGKKNYKHWAMGKKFYQNLWAVTCRTVWKLEEGFEQACRVEQIKRSGVAYMSKYLSKGGDVLNQCIPELLPSAWYTITSSLKDIIKSTTIHGDSHLAEQLYEHIYNGELLSWSREIYSSEHADGSRYLIAWIGQIASRKKFWCIKDNLEYLIYRNTETYSSLYKFDF